MIQLRCAQAMKPIRSPGAAAPIRNLGADKSTRLSITISPLYLTQFTGINMIQLGRLICGKFMDTPAGWLLRRYYRYYMMPWAVRRGYNSNLQWSDVAFAHDGNVNQNDLQIFFDNHRNGNGIWKWSHYFDIYNRHFCKYRDREVNVLEIGVYSGGSLEMWERYFGNKS